MLAALCCARGFTMGQEAGAHAAAHDEDVGHTYIAHMLQYADIDQTHTRTSWLLAPPEDKQ